MTTVFYIACFLAGLIAGRCLSAWLVRRERRRVEAAFGGKEAV